MSNTGKTQTVLGSTEAGTELFDVIFLVDSLYVFFKNWFALLFKVDF